MLQEFRWVESLNAGWAGYPVAILITNTIITYCSFSGLCYLDMSLMMFGKEPLMFEQILPTTDWLEDYHFEIYFMSV